MPPCSLYSTLPLPGVMREVARMVISTLMFLNVLVIVFPSSCYPAAGPFGENEVYFIGPVINQNNCHEQQQHEEHGSGTGTSNLRPKPTTSNVELL